MTVERIGYGAGQKDFRIPNVLRVSIGPGLPGPDPIGRVRAALAADVTTTSNHGPGYADHGHDHTDHGHDHADHAHDHADARASIVRDAPTTTGAGYLKDEVVQIETNIDNMSGEWFGYLSETLMAKGALDVTMVAATMKKGRPATIVTVLVRPDQTDDTVATLFRETTTLGLRIRPTHRLMLPRRSDLVETEFGPIRVKVAMHGASVRSASPEYEDCRAAATRAGVPLQAVMAAASDRWRHAGGPA